MKLRVSLILALLASLVIPGIALADPSIGCTPNTCTIIDFFQDGTQADYWKTYDGNNFAQCDKVETSDTPITLTDDYAFLVIHSGAHYYIWQPAPAGQYSADQTTSFYVVCDKQTPTDVVNPKGSIGGPCFDASYYGVFDNSASTSVAIQFRFRWYTTTGLHTKSKLVPAGAVYTTWVHWAKPGTPVRVGYKDPVTGVWNNLATITAAHGWFPPCDYTPGWSTPTV